MRNTLLGLVFTFCSTMSFGAEIPQIKHFMEEVIENQVRIDENQTILPNSSGFRFSKFKLRLKASVAFDIEFGKLSLVPNIELGWERRPS